MLRCENDHTNAVVSVGQIKDFDTFVDNVLCKGVSTVPFDVSKLMIPLKNTHCFARLRTIVRIAPSRVTMVSLNPCAQ